HLLSDNCQVPHELLVIEAEAEPCEEFAGPPVQLPIINEDPEARLSAEEDVLRHGEIVDEVELLMDDRDPELLGLEGRCYVDVLAVDPELSGIGCIDCRD